MNVGPEEIPPNQWGESEIRGPVHLFRERLLLRLFGRMQPGPRVLDAGCGSGSLALDLCRLGHRVAAFEYSDGFAKTLHQKIIRMGLQHRLSIFRGSATTLAYRSSSFDGLVCGEVLEHLPPEIGGDEAAVREFHRVLRPGAPCVASVPLNPRLWDHSDEWAGHVKRYTRDQFIALFTRSGFRVEQVRVWGFPLGRIYHRLLFAPWLRRTAGQAVGVREQRLDTRAAGRAGLVVLAAGLLRMDELFWRWPWGRGMVLCARRA
ncbi:MAG: class I SAM-dependent methyltransferase [Candidatus Latescibacteria bacterium]|nr:class I SAM-dependent methyltransferase [Candidatus Latescibacterota bacterium]